MNREECINAIQEHLGGSPCGTVFMYCDETYKGDKPHFKVIVAHKDDLLYVLSATSQSFSIFMQSDDLSSDLFELGADDYGPLSCDTFFIVSEIEEISIDQLVYKCEQDGEYFRCKPQISAEYIKQIQSQIVQSHLVIKKHAKIVEKCKIA